jgi:hypothetical protein
MSSGSEQFRNFTPGRAPRPAHRHLPPPPRPPRSGPVQRQEQPASESESPPRNQKARLRTPAAAPRAGRARPRGARRRAGPRGAAATAARASRRRVSVRQKWTTPRRKSTAPRAPRRRRRTAPTTARRRARPRAQHSTARKPLPRKLSMPHKWTPRSSAPLPREGTCRRGGAHSVSGGRAVREGAGEFIIVIISIYRIDSISRTKWTRLVHPSVLTGHVDANRFYLDANRCAAWLL